MFKNTRAKRLTEKNLVESQKRLEAQGKRELTEENLLELKKGLWLDLFSDKYNTATCINNTVLLHPVNPPESSSTKNALVYFDYKTVNLVYYTESSEKAAPLKLSLPYAPSAICSFYMNTAEDARSALPQLALGHKNSILVVHNCAVALELALPDVKLSHFENSVWLEALLSCLAELDRIGNAEPEDLFAETIETTLAKLKTLRETPHVLLSGYSREFLGISCVAPENAQRAQQSLLKKMLADAMRKHGVRSASQLRNVSFQLTEPQVITAVTSLSRDQAIDNEYNRSASFLVIGTEQGYVYIMNPAKHVFLATFETFEPVAVVSATGSYRDYSVVVASREGNVCLLTNGGSKELARLACPVVSMIRAGPKLLVVALMNRKIFLIDATSGSRLATLITPSPITCLSPFCLPAKNFNGFIVCLLDGNVRVYRDHRMLSSIYFAQTAFESVKPLVAARFGPFAREDYCLVVVDSAGSVTVKSLRRTLLSLLDRSTHMDLDTRTAASSARPFSPNDIPPVPEQDTPIEIPKKTQLFVDWMERERQAAKDIHVNFQQKLAQLRLAVARQYKETLEQSLSGKGIAQKDHLRITTKLLGMGPSYKLLINLQNVSTTVALTNLTVTLTSDTATIATTVSNEVLPQYSIQPAAHFLRAVPQGYFSTLISDIEVSPGTQDPETQMLYISSGNIRITASQNKTLIVQLLASIPPFTFISE